MGEYYRVEYEIDISGKIYSFPTLGKLRQFVRRPEIMIKIHSCKHKVTKHLYCDKDSWRHNRFSYPVSSSEFYLFDVI